MVQHFLACLYLNWQKVWKELHQNIQKHSIKNYICSKLYNLIEYGLYQGHLTQPQFSPTITPTTQQTNQVQTQLGWQQMYYSRYLPWWIELCTSHHPNTNSTHYFAKIITLTWQAAITIWTIWNKHLHPSNPMEADCTQLQDTVQQIFHNVQHEPNLHKALQYTTPEQIMKKTTCQIQQWVTIVTTTSATKEKQPRLGPNYTTTTYDSTSLKTTGPT